MFDAVSEKSSLSPLVSIAELNTCRLKSLHVGQCCQATMTIHFGIDWSNSSKFLLNLLALLSPYKTEKYSSLLL